MNIDIYLCGGIFVDSQNRPVNAHEPLTVNAVCTVTVGLFANASATTITEIPAHTSWECAINDVYGVGNTPKVRITSGITIDSSGKAVIPFNPLASESLIKAMGNMPAGMYTLELAGYQSGSSYPDFVVQFPVTIRNRIGQISN